MVVAIRVFTISALLAGALPLAAAAAALPSPNPVAAPPQKAGQFSVVIDRVAPPTLAGLGNDVQTCSQYYDSNGLDCVHHFAAGDLGIAFSWQQCSEADCVTSTASYAVYKVPHGDTAYFFRPGEGPPVAPSLPADHSLVASGKYYGQVGMTLIPASSFSVGDCFAVRVFAGSSPTGAHSTDSNVSCVTSQTRIGTTSTTLYPAATKGGSATSTCGAGPAADGGVGYRAYVPNDRCPDLGTDWTKSWSIEYWAYFDFKIPAQMYIVGGIFKAAGDLSCAHELDAVGDNWEYGDQFPVTYASMDMHGAKLIADVGSWLAGVQGTDFSLKIAPSGQPPGNTCVSYPGATSLDLKILK